MPRRRTPACAKRRTRASPYERSGDQRRQQRQPHALARKAQLQVPYAVRVEREHLCHQLAGLRVLGRQALERAQQEQRFGHGQSRRVALLGQCRQHALGQVDHVVTAPAAQRVPKRRQGELGLLGVGARSAQHGEAGCDTGQALRVQGGERRDRRAALCRQPELFRKARDLGRAQPARRQHRAFLVVLGPDAARRRRRPCAAHQRSNQQTRAHRARASLPAQPGSIFEQPATAPPAAGPAIRPGRFGIPRTPRCSCASVCRPFPHARSTARAATTRANP